MYKLELAHIIPIYLYAVNILKSHILMTHGSDK